MSFTTTFLKTVFISLFVLQTLQKHTCIHDEMEHDIKISGPEYKLYDAPPGGRVLQQYNNMRVVFDSSTLTGVSTAFKNYIVNNLIPPIQNIIQSMLRVPNRKYNLKAGGFRTLCNGDVNVPSIYNTQGVDGDLIIFIKAVNNPSATYVAAASACLLDLTTQRPIIGRITYNSAKVYPTTSDADREQDIVTTLHELTHALGFSSALYKYYVDPATGKTQSKHVITKTVMGFSTTILNLTALNTRIRNHFNCSSIEGAYIENQGGSGSAGSHLERRVFYNDYMTASAIIDTRISEFTLALLEGTGWYQVNYAMAEPMTWGSNKGCSFYQGACVDPVTKAANFPEFCSPLLAKGCSWTGRAGSACAAFSLQVSSTLPSAINWWKNNTVSQDQFSDNCPIQLPYSNLDCENIENQKGATIGAESFGYGSKCFMATLYSGGRLASAYPYCFKQTCKTDAQGKYYVEVKVGTQVANCTSKASITVPGYTGSLQCPDPNAFCQQVMTEGFCRRGCSGRGICVQQQCQCVDGWTGYDCSKPKYTDQCLNCADNDPLQTSCYADTCTCNPNNSTCMCLLGLKTGSVCTRIIAQSIVASTNNTTSVTSTTSTTSNITTIATIASVQDDNTDLSDTQDTNTEENTSDINTEENTSDTTQDDGNNSDTETNMDNADNTDTSTETNGVTQDSNTNNTTQDDGTDNTPLNSGSDNTTQDDSVNTVSQDTNTNITNDVSSLGDTSALGLNQNVTGEIDERTSMHVAERSDNNGITQINASGNSVVLPAALGVVAGILMTLGMLVIIKLFRRFRKGKKQVKTEQVDQETMIKSLRLNRPQRIEIPKKQEENILNQSMNSPELSPYISGKKTHSGSPSVNDSSPTKGLLYTSSRFKNYSSKSHKDFGLNIQPLDFGEEQADLEAPKIEEEVQSPAIFNLESPELKVLGDAQNDLQLTPQKI